MIPAKIFVASRGGRWLINVVFNFEKNPKHHFGGNFPSQITAVQAGVNLALTLGADCVSVVEKGKP
jgi:hypothetical protein